jgi:hypothetical protein
LLTPVSLLGMVAPELGSCQEYKMGYKMSHSAFLSPSRQDFSFRPIWKFIQENQTDQKDKPTRQTSPSAFREQEDDQVTRRTSLASC